MCQPKCQGLCWLQSDTQILAYINCWLLFITRQFVIPTQLLSIITEKIEYRYLWAFECNWTKNHRSFLSEIFVTGALDLFLDSCLLCHLKWYDTMQQIVMRPHLFHSRWLLIIKLNRIYNPKKKKNTNFIK